MGSVGKGNRKEADRIFGAILIVIGAIYLDGGIEPAREFILTYILTDIENKKRFYDAKTNLQEIIQGRCGEVPEYRLISENGPDHAKEYVYEVWSEGQLLGRGSGGSKKSAEQEAVYQALVDLGRFPR